MKLINADCIAAMKDMPDNSVDSIVTDPPYELGFMGKSWDSTGIAFNVEVWQQALRVLKPGGHLIAFSGSRTYHRMAVAIEDAGFEIRDQIMWVYGSGFPKSHNISKGIDKAAGAERTEIIGTRSRNVKPFDDSNGWNENNTTGNHDYTAPATPEAQQWDGWGTALKPAHEPMVLARKPFIGTVANNVLEYGTGGLNIDGCRVGETVETWPKSRSYPYGGDRTYGSTNASTELTQQPPEGRFPANFIHDGSDEVLALFPDTKGKIGMSQQSSGRGLYEGGKSLGDTKINDGIPDSGTAARFFYCAKTSKRDRNEGLEGFEEKEIAGKGHGLGRACATCGSSTLLSCACPDKTFVNPTRANHHPTVKPTDLMRYLVRLVTPPNGTVLDPFMGSGSTGKAAILEGFDFIGIEQDAAYIEIAKARIAYVEQ